MAKRCPATNASLHHPEHARTAAPKLEKISITTWVGRWLTLHRRTDRIESLAEDLNEKVQGWVSYFGKYARSSLHSIYAHINRRLVKWCMWKYRKFKRQAIDWLVRKWTEKPMLFVHWQQTRWFCYYNRNSGKQHG